MLVSLGNIVDVEVSKGNLSLIGAGVANIISQPLKTTQNIDL
ncbi:hypothetical protein [uncultured Gammaproteobacteria bacterium]|nr:hypothetical protein [uncultured Gammaproteobacteria bacterium]CAC9987725.1 hypothetical protein [uncultured Gammaproteobacteria bacterium]